METFLHAAAAGDIPVVEAVLQRLEAEDVDPSFVTNEHGATALHVACATGQSEVVRMLLQAGISYKIVDHQGRTPAEYALQYGHRKLYDDLVEEGVRAEMVLSLLADMNEDDDDDDDDDDDEGSDDEEDDVVDAMGEPVPKGAVLDDARAADERSRAYLSGSVTYNPSGTLLTDAAGDAVMMQWEEPLMERHAAVLTPRPGLHVLNIGFGLGIIDRALQRRAPATHTIVEAHPAVLARMQQEGWMQLPGVRVIAGRWQDVEPQLGTYDAIFFDTFGEDYTQLRKFHALLPRLLRPGGVYSFFNGLAGGQPFLHDVFCRVVELHLSNIGLDTRYERIANSGAAGDWTGVRRRYWSLPEYRLPICTWATPPPPTPAAPAAAAAAAAAAPIGW